MFQASGKTDISKTDVQGIPWQTSGLDSALTAKGLDSIPGLGTKVPQVV